MVGGDNFKKDQFSLPIIRNWRIYGCRSLLGKNVSKFMKGFLQEGSFFFKNSQAKNRIFLISHARPEISPNKIEKITKSTGIL